MLLPFAFPCSRRPLAQGVATDFLTSNCKPCKLIVNLLMRKLVVEMPMLKMKIILKFSSFQFCISVSFL